MIEKIEEGGEIGDFPVERIPQIGFSTSSLIKSETPNPSSYSKLVIYFKHFLLYMAIKNFDKEKRKKVQRGNMEIRQEHR